MNYSRKTRQWKCLYPSKSMGGRQLVQFKTRWTGQSKICCLCPLHQAHRFLSGVIERWKVASHWLLFINSHREVNQTGGSGPDQEAKMSRGTCGYKTASAANKREFANRDLLKERLKKRESKQAPVNSHWPSEIKADYYEIKWLLEQHRPAQPLLLPVEVVQALQFYKSTLW